MLLRQRLEDWLIHTSCLDKRRVRLNDDIALLQPLGDILARAPRVNLVLTDGNLTTASTLDVIF